MPKIKKTSEDEENQYPLNNIKVKKRKKVFKFDIQRILKERQADNEFWKRSAEIDKHMEAVDVLYQAEVNKPLFENVIQSVSTKMGHVIFDHAKYNILFKNKQNIDIIQSFSHQLLLMSIEENELIANIHFINLMKADWSPSLNDVKNILFNWGTDMDTLENQPQPKCQIENHERIGWHNFTFVMNFITQSILKKNNKFKNDDLLTLAKFTAIIYLDYHCGKMINAIKKLFSACVETAMSECDDTVIIAFSQELYSNHVKEDLLNMVVDICLPIRGHVMQKIYSYLTYKLYKSFLGKTNNINAFPNSINDWFVQNLVNGDYFKQSPKQILYIVIRLLEHIVVIFDLYQDEDKLNKMYEFLYYFAKPTTLLDSRELISVIEQWKMKLFRLHVYRSNILV